jgi:hypothetical protein
MSTMSDPQATTPRARRWRRIVAVQIVLVIFGLGALEIGARAWFWIRHETYDAAETRRQVLHLLDVNRDFVPRAEHDEDAAPKDPDQDRVLHPYLGWEMVQGNQLLDDEFNWLHSPASSDATQILIVGGSVAAGFSLELMGRGRLAEIVHADPRLAGRKLHFMTFARGGFKEPQQINAVNFLLGLGFDPRVVINIDGFNEVALGNNNWAEGSHPAYPSAAHWAHLAVWGSSDSEALDKVTAIRDSQRSIEQWGSFILAWRLDRSCVLGKLALHRMYRLRHDIVDEFTAYGKYLAERQNSTSMHGPALAGGEMDAVKASVECWKESSRTLSDICRARGIIYLHVLQPTLFDAGSKPLTAKEIANGKADDTWKHGVQLGYPLLRQEGEELRRLGVDFIDATQIFAKRADELYYDCCHFVRAGHELLAEKIGPELVARMTEKR